MEFAQAFQKLEEANQALNIGDENTALKIFENLAKQGYQPAMFMMGYMLSTSSRYIEPDYERAAYWFDLAIESTQGKDPMSALGLAKLYFKGLGVQQDHSQALELLMPHQDGEPRINMLIGRILMDGDMPENDLEAAIDQFETAYKKGNWYALKYLGWATVENGNVMKGWMRLLKGVALTLFAGLRGDHERIYPY